MKVSIAACCAFLLAALVSTDATQAQGFLRSVTMNGPPTNEVTEVPKETARFGWFCSRYDGRLLDDCPFTLELQGIGGYEVTEACVPDADGEIPYRTCGNGGHTHGESTRPLVFAGGSIVYPPGDADPLPYRVEGFTNTTFTPASWIVPQAGGIYALFSTLGPGPGRFFWMQGAFPDGRLYLLGNVNLSVSRRFLRDLTQIPDLDIYRKRRAPGDDSHKDPVAFSADEITIAILPMVAEEYRAALPPPTRLLSINDISLPKGGAFDLNDNWNVGVSSHRTHRNGRDVDLNRAPVIEGTNEPGLAIDCIDDLALQAAVRKLLVPIANRNTNVPQPTPASALLCETGGRKHLDITTLAPQ